MLIEDAGHGDAEGVGDDGDRHGRYDEDGPFPKAAPVKIGQQAGP